MTSNKECVETIKKEFEKEIAVFELEKKTGSICIQVNVFRGVIGNINLAPKTSIFFNKQEKT